MLRLTPPRITDQFRKSEKIKTAKASIKKAIQDKTNPSFGPHWSDFKPIFSASQFGRCGFCEQKVKGNQYGDVEHFRPKGAVWKLKSDPATWGTEKPNLSTIEGREHDEVRKTGYWWLAYDWENYLLSCSTCNSVYKSSFFPVANDAYKTGPRSAKKDEPLLLNPFRGPRPETHLIYDELGAMSARNDSRIGTETIKYLGLNRTGLIEEREPIAKRVLRNCHDLAEGSPELQSRAAEDLYDMGEAGHAFAGMVRIIFEQNTELRWKDLKDRVDQG